MKGDTAFTPAVSLVAAMRTALDLIMTVTATGERIVLENQYVRDDQQQRPVGGDREPCPDQKAPEIERVARNGINPVHDEFFKAQDLADALEDFRGRNRRFGLAPEQVAGLVVAYEPVWAIGTGRTATRQGESPRLRRRG